MGASLDWDVTKTYTDTKCTIKVVLYVKSNSGSWNGNAQSGYIKINGEKHSFTHSFSSNTTTKLASASETVARGASDKTVPIAAAYATGISVGTITKTGSVSVADLPTYTVTFNKNGGSTTSTASVDHGKTAKFPSSAGAKTGYTLNKWGTTSSGGTLYAPGATTPVITSSRSYYAQWIPNTYYVAYNGNDYTSGSMSSSTHTYDTAKSLTANSFVKTGHSFAGWATSSTGAVVYGNGASVKNLTTANKGTITLYAKWNINQYNLILNNNNSSTTVTRDYGTTYTLPTLTLPGYKFQGWNTKADGTGTSYNVGSTYTFPAANQTLYAQWKIAIFNPTITKLIATRVDLTDNYDNLSVQIQGNSGYFQESGNKPVQLNYQIKVNSSSISSGEISDYDDSTGAYTLDYVTSHTGGTDDEGYSKSLAYNIEVTVTSVFSSSLTSENGTISKTTFLSKDLPIIQIPHSTSNNLDKRIRFGRGLIINDGNTAGINTVIDGTNGIVLNKNGNGLACINNQGGISGTALYVRPTNIVQSPTVTINNNGTITATNNIIGKECISRTTESLSFGDYVSVGVLTSTSSLLEFSIPTGRVFPNGTTIQAFSCSMVARAGRSTGTGLYIIRNAKADGTAGTDAVPFTYGQTFDFWNGSGTGRHMLPTAQSITLNGNTNLCIVFRTNTDNYFTDANTSSDTNMLLSNNQPVVIRLYNIYITMNIPS